MPSPIALDILAARIRAVLPDEIAAQTVEKRMFGGVGFMLAGNLLCCAARNGGLLLRVGAEAMESALRLPSAAPFVNGARPMTGYVILSADGVADDGALARATGLAVDFVAALPVKTAKPAARRKQR